MKTIICAGIDIGGTNSKIGLVEDNGKVIFRESLSTRKYANANIFVKDVAAIILDAVKKSGSKLKGIGIGAPNGNYYSGSIDHAPNMPWKGKILLAEMLQKETGAPAVLTNDAKAAAIGEQLFGAAKGLNNFVEVTLGTGLGSGFVVNGAVVYGNDGFAGELGHVIIERHGRKCGCGRFGCLETYVSATGIVRTAKEWLEFEQEPTSLRSIPIDKLDSRNISEAAAKGDSLALRLFDFTAEKLGFALANMVTITSPSHIFLYGGLAKAGDFILRPTKHYMEEYMLGNYKGKVNLRLSGLPDNAAIIGAAALAWKH